MLFTLAGTWPSERRACAGRHRAAIAAVAVALVAAGSAEAGAPPLRLEGLTFVATRESSAELRLVASVAVIDEATNTAQLDEVDAEWADDAGRPSLSVRCEHGELDLTTNDLLARGDVRGRLADGRRFLGPWLRYDRARGVAFVTAPVEIIEANGRVMRGGGLEYHVKKRRLRLTAGARVEERGTR